MQKIDPVLCVVVKKQNHAKSKNDLHTEESLKTPVLDILTLISEGYLIIIAMLDLL